MIHLLAGAGGPGADWFSRIRVLMARAEGAYTLTIGTRDAVYGVRDPWGLRPLVLGELAGRRLRAGVGELRAGAPSVPSWSPRSGPARSCASTGDGYQISGRRPPQRSRFCTFEEIYFARPDSVFRGRLVHQTRQALGRQLAREAPVQGGADIVVPVPDSGIPHAIGYAQ